MSGGIDLFGGGGAVFKDVAPVAPTSALDWFKAASPIISGVFGNGAPPTSSANSSAYQNSSFDTSGFQVNTGGGGTNSATGNNYVMYAAIAAAFVVAYKYFNRK